MNLRSLEMATASEQVQNLLRFLTQDAKIPLATAMSKVNELRKAKLGTPEAIGHTSLPTVETVFGNAQLAKQVFNAAKRASKPKKRKASTTAASPNGKRFRDGAQVSPLEQEKELFLPSFNDQNSLASTTIETNRAPLVLAFAVVLLSYTHPQQPLSSRLSLAQAIVSANSRSKAQAIGIEAGKSAEDEGWGQGQPKIKIMGREVPVMRRSGYLAELMEEEFACQKDGTETEVAKRSGPEEEAFWGLDLETLRKTKGAPTGAGHLPIHSAKSARSYLSRSFALVETVKHSKSGKPTKTEPDSQVTVSDSPPKSSPKKIKKKTPAELSAEREQALAHLLASIDLLYQSWAISLSRDELDRRAWQWYLYVRPDVKQGEAGWGQRGQVKLCDILALRKEAK